MGASGSNPGSDTHQIADQASTRRFAASAGLAGISGLELTQLVVRPRKLQLALTLPSQATCVVLIQPREDIPHAFVKNAHLALSVQGAGMPPGLDALLRRMAGHELAGTTFEMLIAPLTFIRVEQPTPPQPPKTAPQGPPPLESVEWCTTLRCNQSCDHCSLRAGSAVSGELSTDEALGVVDSLQKMGAQQVVLTGGEFLTRPDWRILLAATLQAIPNVIVSTNGWLGQELLQEVPKLPHTNRLKMSVSIVGPQAVHDGRRGPDSFRRALQFLEALSDAKPNVLTAVGLDNVESLGELRNLLADRDLTWNLWPVVHVGRADSGIALPPSHFDALARFMVETRQEWAHRIRVRASNWFEQKMPVLNWAGEQGCNCGFSTFFIAANGDVLSCQILLPHAWENLKRVPLEEIWRRYREEERRKVCHFARYLG